MKSVHENSSAVSLIQLRTNRVIAANYPEEIPVSIRSEHSGPFCDKSKKMKGHACGHLQDQNLDD